MDKVLYLAMSGARENMRSQHAHSNNLANANTTGFKADLAQARAMPVYGEGEASRVYAMSERPATDVTPGVLQQTGRDLDVAIEGDGWFGVLGPNGQELYTRYGEFRVNELNQLVTAGGIQVMGNGGIPITLPAHEKLDIGGDGIISIQPLGQGPESLAAVNQIKVVNPEPGTLFKGTDGFMRSGSPDPLPLATDVKVVSGFLEASNVNSVSELTSIIGLSRQFEMQINMMTKAEENSTTAARILQLQ